MEKLFWIANTYLYAAETNKKSPQGSLSYHKFSSTAGCGGTFNSLTGTFTSPNYPNNFENNQDCSWLIILPHVCKVKLTFEDFVMEVQNDCGYDKVEIFDGGSSDATKQTFCGTNNPGKCRTTTTNFVFCQFWKLRCRLSLTIDIL